MNPRGSTRVKVESNCYGRPLTGPCPIQLLSSNLMCSCVVRGDLLDRSSQSECEVMKVNLSYTDVMFGQFYLQCKNIEVFKMLIF